MRPDRIVKQTTLVKFRMGKRKSSFAEVTEVYRSPFTVHRSPFTVHRLPFTVYRLPFTVHRSPFTVHRSPFTVHRSPCLPFGLGAKQLILTGHRAMT
jgi:hypothetical protein